MCCAGLSYLSYLSYREEKAMPDYINRNEFKEKYLCCGYLPEMSESKFDAFPAYDAPQIIHCKDCAKDGLFTCPMCWIENHTLEFINHDPNFYCGAAERK